MIKNLKSSLIQEILQTQMISYFRHNHKIINKIIKEIVVIFQIQKQNGTNNLAANLRLAFWSKKT